LDCAAQIILEKGLLDTSIAEIAHAAGISSALVHANYKTKSGLVNAILENFLGELRFGIELLLEYRTSSQREIDYLLAVTRAVIGAFQRHQQHGKFVLRHLWNALGDEGDPDREEMKPLFAIFNDVDEALKQAAKKNQLSNAVSTFEPWQIRQLIFGTLHTLLISYYLDAGRPRGAKALTPETVELGALRVLQMCVNGEARQVVDEVVNRLEKVVAGKPSPASSSKGGAARS
jgi:AcrR family transcriptional regulator